MYKYNKVSECPPKLKILIDVFNELPLNLQELKPNVEKLQKEGATVEELEDYLKGIFKQLNPLVQNYLTSKVGDEIWLWESALSQLANDESNLDFIIDFADSDRLIRKYQEEIKENGEKVTVRVNGQKVNDFDFKEFFFPQYTQQNEYKNSIAIASFDYSSTPTKPIVNKNGFLELLHSGLNEAIQETPIEVDRIRRCDYCRKVFWAKKKNSETCGNKSCIEGLGNYKRLSKKKLQKKISEHQQRFKRKHWVNQNFNQKGEKKNDSL